MMGNMPLRTKMPTFGDPHRARLEKSKAQKHIQFLCNALLWNFPPWKHAPVAKIGIYFCSKWNIFHHIGIYHLEYAFSGLLLTYEYGIKITPSMKHRGGLGETAFFIMSNTRWWCNWTNGADKVIMHSKFLVGTRWSCTLLILVMEKCMITWSFQW